MRHAYRDGAPGVLVSGLFWAAAAIALLFLWHQPRRMDSAYRWRADFPSQCHSHKGNRAAGAGQRQRAQPTCHNFDHLAYSVLRNDSWSLFVETRAFFPAMMGAIGCRYLVFSSVFGRAIFWAIGASLITEVPRTSPSNRSVNSYSGSYRPVSDRPNSAQAV